MPLLGLDFTGGIKHVHAPRGNDADKGGWGEPFTCVDEALGASVAHSESGIGLPHYKSFATFDAPLPLAAISNNRRADIPVRS